MKKSRRMRRWINKIGRKDKIEGKTKEKILEKEEDETEVEEDEEEMYPKYCVFLTPNNDRKCYNKYDEENLFKKTNKNENNS